MHNAIWMCEILRGQAYGIKSEFRKSHKDSMGVLNVRFDKNIEIPGITRSPMKGQRVSTDNQVFNVVFVE